MVQVVDDDNGNPKEPTELQKAREDWRDFSLAGALSSRPDRA